MLTYGANGRRQDETISIISFSNKKVRTWVLAWCKLTVKRLIAGKRKSNMGTGSCSWLTLLMFSLLVSYFRRGIFSSITACVNYSISDSI